MARATFAGELKTALTPHREAAEMNRNQGSRPQTGSRTCVRCSRTFRNAYALVQHVRDSPRHHVCNHCNYDHETRHEMNNCGCTASEDDYDESAGTLSDEGLVAWGYQEHYDDGWWSDDDHGPTYMDDMVTWIGGDRYHDHDHYDTYGSGYGSSSQNWSESEIDDGSISDNSHLSGRNVPDPAAVPYCQRCDRTFMTQQGLESHLRQSSQHPFYCLACKIDFDRVDDLRAHAESGHRQPETVQRVGGQGLTPPSPPPVFTRAYAAARAAEAAARRQATTASAASAADTSLSTIRGPEGSPIAATSQVPTSVGGIAPSSSKNPTTTKPAITVTCPLCLDRAEALTSTLCGHVFCKECVTAAVQHKPECPVCRAYSHPRSLHPIYLNILS